MLEPSQETFRRHVSTEDVYDLPDMIYTKKRQKVKLLLPFAFYLV